jgi:chromosome segregation ATPase
LKLNREWEGKVHSIKNVLQDLEEKNSHYKEDNEKLRDEIDQLNFMLSLLQEKEKVHETNYKNLKDLQNEYDTRTEDLKRDYRLKEENLKKKYDRLEESVNSKLREQEEEHQEKINKLQNQIKEFQKANIKHEKDLEEYREKLLESERFFKIKEEEFEDVVSSKDRKLKELEMCIKSISDEASHQINKLSDSVSEFNDKINLYKLKESQMQMEYNGLRNQYQMLLKKSEENLSQGMKSFDAGNNTSSNERRNTLNTVELIVKI